MTDRADDTDLAARLADIRAAWIDYWTAPTTGDPLAALARINSLLGVTADDIGQRWPKAPHHKEAPE